MQEREVVWPESHLWAVIIKRERADLQRFDSIAKKMVKGLSYSRIFGGRRRFEDVKVGLSSTAKPVKNK